MSEPLDPLDSFDQVIECFRVTWVNGESKLVRLVGVWNLTPTSLNFEDERGITELIPLYQVQNIERVFVKVTTNGSDETGE